MKPYMIDMTDDAVYAEYFDKLGGPFACAARMTETRLTRADVRYFKDVVWAGNLMRDNFYPRDATSVAAGIINGLWADRYLLCEHFMADRNCPAGVYCLMAHISDMAHERLAMRFADWRGLHIRAVQPGRADVLIEMRRPFIAAQIQKSRGN